MKKAKTKRNEAAGCAVALTVFIIGVVLFVLIPILGWLVGPLLCFVAILSVSHRDKVWRCTDCRTIVPRG